MLMAFDESKDAYRSRDLGMASGPNLIKSPSLPCLRTQGRKKARHAAIDRTPHRQQALDLLQALQGSQASDASAKLAVLWSLAGKLEALFQNLVGAGDRDPSVEEMGKVLLRLHALLSESQPAETDILDVWTQIDNCLQCWVALTDATESPRREGFWK